MDNKTIKKPIQNYLEHHWTRAGEIIDEFNEYGEGPEEEEELAPTTDIGNNSSVRFQVFVNVVKRFADSGRRHQCCISG